MAVDAKGVLNQFLAVAKELGKQEGSARVVGILMDRENERERQNMAVFPSILTECSVS